jgi:hypothetical protein
MNGIPERGASSKADRALKLHEQGLTRAQIAERLCMKPDSVKGDARSGQAAAGQDEHGGTKLNRART